jgi:hypothetical protein
VTTILCFDAHREDGLVWSVRQGNKWLNFKTVIVTVPMATVYKGKDAIQPKAYLQTVEPVIIHEANGSAWIVAA